jgi:hypothetical protein
MAIDVLDVLAAAPPFSAAAVADDPCPLVAYWAEPDSVAYWPGCSGGDAVEWDLEIADGTDRDVEFVAQTETDITGWSIAFAVKDEDTGDRVLTASTGAGTIDLTDPEAGTFTVLLTSAGTDALDPRDSYRYDVWRTDAGSRTLLARGRLRVLDRVVEFD